MRLRCNTLTIMRERWLQELLRCLSAQAPKVHVQAPRLTTDMLTSDITCASPTDLKWSFLVVLPAAGWRRFLLHHCVLTFNFSKKRTSLVLAYGSHLRVPNQVRCWIYIVVSNKYACISFI